MVDFQTCSIIRGYTAYNTLEAITAENFPSNSRCDTTAATEQITRRLFVFSRQRSVLLNIANPPCTNCFLSCFDLREGLPILNAATTVGVALIETAPICLLDGCGLGLVAGYSVIRAMMRAGQSKRSEKPFIVQYLLKTMFAATLIQ